MDFLKKLKFWKRRHNVSKKGSEILTVKWGHVIGCVVSCTQTLRKHKLFHFKVQLLNTPESACKITLQFWFVKSVYVVRYITDIICRAVAEAVQKTEIALQHTWINTVHFVNWWQLPYFRRHYILQCSQPIRKLPCQHSKIDTNSVLYFTVTKKKHHEQRLYKYVRHKRTIILLWMRRGY